MNDEEGGRQWGERHVTLKGYQELNVTRVRLLPDTRSFSILDSFLLA